MTDKGQNKESHSIRTVRTGADIDDFVLEKSIFSNVFEKDIRRVYLYKKAERLAKALRLVGPAFVNSPALTARIDSIAVTLIDASVLTPAAAKEALSRELLTLSSLLGVARTGGMLSPMNADLISKEAQSLLQEVVSYEEPRVTLEEIPSLATLAKSPSLQESKEGTKLRSVARITYDPVFDGEKDQGHSKGQIKDKELARREGTTNGRRESILAVLGAKGPSYIKDISMVIRDVSEKTIQRELAVLVSEGVVERKGDRRWTTYQLATS